MGARDRTSATATHGVAASASALGSEAVGQAAREAVRKLGGDSLGLLLAFVSGDLDHASAAASLQEAASGAPTAGMTGRGLISAEGPIEEGCVAMAFGPGTRAAVGACEERTDLRSAGRVSAERALEAIGEDPDLVLLFVDSTNGDLADGVSGAYQATGPSVPLAGGAAAGALKSHFHDGRATCDGVVAVALASSGPLGIGDAQTCTTRGTPSIVTSSEGQVVKEIDGRPAEEVYLEQLGFAGVALEDADFDALAITHPLAQPELHGELRLRHVTGRTGDGAIRTGTHIPASAAIEFTELEFDQLLDSGARSVSDAAAALGDADPRAALVFDCAGRRRALRDGLDQEVDAISRALGSPPGPLAGLYTSGEVARLQGAKGDRNHAVVTVAFG